MGQSDELSVKGRLLRAIFPPAGMVLTELLINGGLGELSPPELAEVASWFTFDDDRTLRNFNQLSQRLQQGRREGYTTQQRVLGAGYEEGLRPSPGIGGSFQSARPNWWPR